ncbi:MAG: ankyrin repeat domain-containing protein, partial [Pseudomonadota bacterium]
MSVTNLSLATILLTSYSASVNGRIEGYVEQGNTTVFTPLSEKEFCKNDFNLTSINLMLENAQIDIDQLALFAELEKDESENYDLDIDYSRIFKSPLKFNDQSSMAAVKSLLELNVDVDLFDHNGETLMSYAASYGNIETMQLLLKHGADVNNVPPEPNNYWNNHPPLVAAAKSQLNDTAT